MDEKLTIELRCRKKANDLLEKYFPNFITEAASGKNELLSPIYDDNLPHRIAEEFRLWLSELWSEIANDSTKTFDEIMNLQRSVEMVDSSYAPYLKDARDDAKKTTLWERVIKSNHEDVVFYKGLLKQYAEELLDVMIKDFCGDLSF